MNWAISIQPLGRSNVATERMPTNPEPVYNLGLTLERAERFSDSLQLYETATAMSPDNPTYLGNLIRVHLKLGTPVELLTAEIQQLLLLETRPDWRQWATDLLNYDVVAAYSKSDNSDAGEDITEQTGPEAESAEPLPPPRLQLVDPAYGEIPMPPS